MNSKLNELRKLIRKEIRKMISEDGVQLPPTPQLASAKKAQIDATKKALDADKKEIKAKEDALKKMQQTVK